MSLLVMKFGGTSVGDAAAIRALGAIVAQHRREWDQVAVVVSAMSGVTDLLLRGAQTAAAGDAATFGEIAATLRERHLTAHRELAGDAVVDPAIERFIDEFTLLCRSVLVLGEVTPRALDAIGGLGERMSARLVAGALHAAAISASAVDASECVVTTAEFGAAVPIYPATRERIRGRIGPLLAAGVVPVITGFIGATEQGVQTTLGRGGSDYSGAIFGAALDADEVAIYTDVDGVMTTDPRLTREARIIHTLSYAEMAELAYFGARVLHPRTIRPVVERGIPLRIRNTFNADHPGTLVVRDAVADGRAVKAVTSIKQMSLITVAGRGMIGVPGVAARTFVAVASVGANVLMISQASSEQSICFIVPSPTTGAVVAALEAHLRQELARRDIERINPRDDVVIVTAVGAGMHETPGVASLVFGALAAEHINVIAIAQGSSECAISVVVTAHDADAAVRAIHRLTC